MLGAFAAFGSSLTWAIGSSVYSPLSKKYSALTVNLCRAMTALPVFLVLITLSGRWSDFLVITRPEVLWLVASILASYATGDALFLVSSQSLGVPGALAIASSYPIWSAIAGAVFLGQPLSVSKMLALLGVVGGVVVVIASDFRGAKNREVSRCHLFGVATAFATSFFWSLNTFANSKVSPLISSFVANSIRMGAGIIVCAAFIRLNHSRRGPRHFTVNRADWKRFGWIFCFEGAGGSFLFVYGLTHSSLAVAAALSSLAPAISVPIALVSGRERLVPLKIVGVLVVVISIVWLVSVR